MIEKHYYRIGELKEKFGFSEYDYRYLCEQFDIPVFAYVHSEFFLLAETIEQSLTRTLKGVACYKGLVRLTDWDKKTLLRHGKVTLRTCYLDSCSGIGLLERSPDKSLDLIQQGAFEIKNAFSINQLDLDCTDAILIGEENRELAMPQSSSIERIINLDFDCLVFKKEQVDWCKFKLDIEDLSDLNNRRDLMRTQIRDLMRKYPKLGASALFKLIHENHINDIDDTDPYSLIIEVSVDKIVWGKPEKDEHVMTKKRFQNIVAELKKEKK